ncbi:MAG: ABC transporter permease [Chloroflexi bacterium]|nr:MAG: ABC transporter permease [Chloroflexota bacterium]
MLRECYFYKNRHSRLFALPLPRNNKRGIFMQQTLEISKQNSVQQRIAKYNRLLWRLGRGRPISFSLVLILWYWVAHSGKVKSFLLPTPEAVFETFHRVLTDGDNVFDSTLWYHTSATLGRVLPGLAIGLTIGISLGYIIAKSPLLETLLSPIVVAFQSMPIVAYAPVLVIWFGTGSQSKILTCVLIVFFPMLMNTIVGIRSVPQNLRDLMKMYRASRWQMFRKLEVPAALPILLTGMKTSATLSVIGAVVGEFIVANEGLGVLITEARGSYNTPLVFVSAISMSALASTLYSIVAFIERRFMRR